MINRKKIVSTIFGILFIFNTWLGYSQNLDGLYALLPDNSKDIERALNSVSEAGKLTQEANSYYNEALELQSNYDLDEKTLQKELSKAENKALSLQLKADKLYAEAYKSLYNICLNTVKSSTVSYGETGSYESSATEMMNEAAGKRVEAAGKDSPYEKAELLNDAAGLEGAAIENLLFALQIQSGSVSESAMAEEPAQDVIYQEQETVPVVTPAVSQKSENISIDESEISKYESYVNDSTIPDPITLTRAGVSGVSDPDMEAAMSIFYAMHTGNAMLAATETEQKADEQQDAIADSVNYLAQTTSEEITTETGFVQGTGTYQENTDYSYTSQSTGIRFIVQVAASRAPLTRAQLWAIYPGKYTIEVMKEDGWYKYRITNFRLFSDANRVALESGVKSAYVVSTDGKNMVNLLEAREMTRVLESDVKNYGTRALKDRTDFYVQLAATRIRLTDKDKFAFCGSSGPCREIIEEGWFKYQIYAGTEYQQAVQLKNQIAAKTFIVAYERGSKVNLYKAANRNK